MIEETSPGSPIKTWLSWSSGKDCAWALRELRRGGDLEVTALLTTVDEASQRVAMHRVRRQLVEAQAAALGLPLVVVDLPWPCPNTEYERRLGRACARAFDEGVGAMAFGDLFLEDVRAYRESKLEGTGLRPIFPLWGRDTADLARRMIEGGLRAIVACVDTARLPASFAGRAYDAELLADLPAGVDPCGEGGELHTFVHDGPGFVRPIPVSVGEMRERDGFAFVDLGVPAPDAPSSELVRASPSGIPGSP
ncbi:MAG: adenine nucleotide alpha hydrolase [Holophagales bacterium]|nr:adenine nucleotide alpha hydrolase [Holophagales bacterium]